MRLEGARIRNKNSPPPCTKHNPGKERARGEDGVELNVGWFSYSFKKLTLACASNLRLYLFSKHA